MPGSDKAKQMVKCELLYIHPGIQRWPTLRNIEVVRKHLKNMYSIESDT
jgi:hypothetical protein